MKYQLKPLAHNPQLYRLEFDRVIPQLFPRIPGVARPQCADRESLLYWSSPNGKLKHAKVLARANRGKVPFELTEPIQVYAQILEQLSLIDGLIEVADLDRYTFGLQVGTFFNATLIAEQVATIMQKNLYGEEDLEQQSVVAEATAEIDGQPSLPDPAASGDQETKLQP